MDPFKTLGTIAVSLIMVFSTLIIVHSNNVIANDDMGSYMTRADRIVLQEGTIIELAPGQLTNNTYYFPIPKESKILSTNITISNRGYEIGGRTGYTRDASFNIAGGSKEYVHGIPDQPFNGFWGLQNQTRNGRGEEIGIDMTITNPHVSRFVIPKNASIEYASINLTGYQRSEEWRHYSFLTGDSSGDRLGSEVRDLENGYVAISDPSTNSETGEVYIMTSDTLNWGPAQGSKLLTRFGESISTAFYFGKDEAIAVGAPRQDNFKGSVSIVEVSSSMTQLFTIEGNSTSDAFGSEVEVGDIDGDDNPELIVGAPGANSGQGRVLIFEQFFNGTGYEFIFMDSINGSASGTSFGKEISLGDMNGDGTYDLVIAGDDNASLYYGGSPLDLTEDVVFDPVSDSGISEIGAVEFIDSQDTSSFESLSIGSPSSGGGVVSIYFGSISVDSTRDRTITAPSGRGMFGYAIDPGYDMDGDGRSEICIGAPSSGVNSGWTGIYSIKSSASLVDSFIFGFTGDEYGHSVAFGPDMRRDGFGDLVVGSPGYQMNGEYSRVYFQERYPIEELPSNKPKLHLDGSEIWEYPQERLGGGDIITTSDLSTFIDEYVSTATAAFSTPYEEYVYVDLLLIVDSPSSFESSSIFDIGDYRIEYSIQKVVPDIADHLNSYIDTKDPDEFGNINIPVIFSGKSPGGLSIDRFEYTIDRSPEIYGVPTNLHIDEGSNESALIDLHQVFEDDLDPDDTLTYYIGKEIDNTSYYELNLTDGRYLGIDMTTSKISRNWSGSIWVSASAVDTSGSITNTDPIEIVVDPVNDPPSLINTPDTNIIQGNQYRFISSSEDAEMDKIYYSLEDEPENMTVDPLGTIIWTPNAWQIGINNFTFIITDGNDSSMYGISVDVININDPPIFLTVPPENAEVLVGEEYSIQLTAYDLDPEDIIGYSIVQGPSNAEIDFNTGLFTWTPLVYESEPQTFLIRATDLNGGSTDIEISINITFEDSPPEIISEPEKTLDELHLWTYTIEVNDIDEDLIFIELFDHPEGMEYNEINDNITWIPEDHQVGRFDISIKVSSTRYVLFQNFTLNVLRSPRDWDLIISDITQGQKIKGSEVRIGGSISVSPSTVENVYFRVDDGEWMEGTVNDDAWFIILDSTIYSDGTHTIYVKGYDGYENSTEKEIQIKIANDEGKVSPIIYLVIILVILIVLGVLALTVFLINKKLQAKKEEEEKQKKIQEIKRSKDDIDDFLDEANMIKDETGEFDNIEEEVIDEERLSVIDDIFSPATTGGAQTSGGNINDDIPEDPLMNADVSTAPAGTEPPAVEPEPVASDDNPSMNDISMEQEESNNP